MPIQTSNACGVNSHMWISDTAMCRLSDQSQIRQWLNTQKLVDLVRLGSFFPDSGYVANHAYGELTHWSPFINTYIESLKNKYQGVFDGTSAKEDIAFLFGVAAHGFEDELFDTIFLRRSLEIENTDQDLADPGVDYLLTSQGKTHIKPAFYFPMESVIEAIRATNTEVEQSNISLGMNRAYLATALVTAPMAAANLAQPYYDSMPWVASHFDDFAIPGSLNQEPYFVGQLFESIWLQLKGEWKAEQGFIGSVPAEGQLLESAGLIADRTVSFIFSLGMYEPTIREHLKIEDEMGQEIEYELAFNRWSNGNDYSRVIQVLITTPLIAGRGYQFKFLPGIRWVNGSVLDVEKNFFFYARCEMGATEERCMPRVIEEGVKGGAQRGCLVTMEEEMVQIAQMDMGVDQALLDVALVQDQLVQDASVIEKDMHLMDISVRVEDLGMTEKHQGCMQKNHGGTLGMMVVLFLIYVLNMFVLRQCNRMVDIDKI